jgi:hypothetical protein
VKGVLDDGDDFVAVEVDEIHRPAEADVDGVGAEDLTVERPGLERAVDQGGDDGDFGAMDD